jgi:hypothetical protein
MRRVLAILTVLLLGVCAASVMAAPGGGIDEKPWSYPHSTTSIIPEQEPNDVCPGQTIACGDVVAPASFSVPTDDDWYAFYVDQAGTLLTLGTDSYNGSNVDTYLQLYDSCTGSYIAYDDDSGPNAFSLITNFPAPHAGWYYAKTYTYSHSSTGEYQFFVTCTPGTPPPLPPPNDQCSGAIAIDRCTTGTLTGDLTNATNDYDPGAGGCATGYSEAGRDVAYVMGLVAGDVVSLTYTGNGYDASIYIVTDCANAAGSCVIGADAGYNVETINWTVPATGTYYLILDAYGTNAGSTFSLAWSITCPPPPVPHVCCVDEACLIIFEADCAAIGGVWHPEWDSCGPPNPCGLAHVCCVGEECLLMIAEECGELGGVFHPEWSSCGPPNPCGLPHVCCVGEDCFVMLMEECGELGGVFHPEWETCGPPNPCQPTPVLPDTWGGVKNLYR